MKSKSGVYRIKNDGTGKAYVGRAVSIPKRWTRHRWELERGTHRNSPLQADWKRYGATMFTFEVLAFIDGLVGEALDQALAAAEHAALSAEHDAYNLMEAGRLSLTASEETRAKLSVERKARWADPAYKERLRASHRAVHADPEYASRRGRAISEAKSTPEARQKVSDQNAAMWAPGGALRETQSECRKAIWQDPGYAAQQHESRVASHARRKAEREKPPE